MSNKPDALSGRSDHIDLPKLQLVMLPEERFIGFTLDMSVDIISLIQDAQADDEALKALIRNTKGKEQLPPSVRKGYKRYTWDKGLLWYDGRIVIPNNSEIQLNLLEQHHDNPAARHQGQARTLELPSRRYYWSEMKISVNKCVDSCEVRQRSKGSKQWVPRRSPELPERPWEEINYDFIVKLPLSNGFDSILVVVDRFSRQAHFMHCNKSINAEQLAEIFIKEVWRPHGLPKRTISNQGSMFNSHLLQALYQKLNIEPNFSTAYHPETNEWPCRTHKPVVGRSPSQLLQLRAR